MGQSRSCFANNTEDNSWNSHVSHKLLLPHQSSSGLATELPATSATDAKNESTNSSLDNNFNTNAESRCNRNNLAGNRVTDQDSQGIELQHDLSNNLPPLGDPQQYLKTQHRLRHLKKTHKRLKDDNQDDNQDDNCSVKSIPGLSSFLGEDPMNTVPANISLSFSTMGKRNIDVGTYMTKQSTAPKIKSRLFSRQLLKFIPTKKKSKAEVNEDINTGISMKRKGNLSHFTAQKSDVSNTDTGNLLRLNDKTTTNNGEYICGIFNEKLKLPGLNGAHVSSHIFNAFTLDLGPRYRMKFFFTKVGKNPSKSRGRRSNKTTEKHHSGGKVLSNDNLAGSVNAKTKLVKKDPEEAWKNMAQRITRGSKKATSDDHLLIFGKQIYACRYLDSKKVSNVTTKQNIGSLETREASNRDKDGNCKSYDEKQVKEYDCTHVKGKESDSLGNIEPREKNTADDIKTVIWCLNSSNIEEKSLELPHAEKKEISQYGQFLLQKYSKFVKDEDNESNRGQNENKIELPVLLYGGIASTLYTASTLTNAKVSHATDIVCISKEHSIYVCDIGLTSSQCNFIVDVTEYCSRGSYASYTYAKQTLGCREYDELSVVCEWPVKRAYSTISKYLEQTDGECKELDESKQPLKAKKRSLVLDDREPHVVKYDTSRFERQKLDMHTDKSEWTFLISLSNGEGQDYDGGGTYFEAINSTIHLQKGHDVMSILALIFPGKLRHRGQKIISGTRFLLVGFLIERRGNRDTMGAGKYMSSSSFF